MAWPAFKVLRTIDGSQGRVACALSPDGACLAIGDAAGSLRLLESLSTSCVFSYKTDGGPISSVVWGPGGEDLVCCINGAEPLMLRFTAGASAPVSITTGVAEFRCCAIGPTNLLAAGLADGDVRIYNNSVCVQEMSALGKDVRTIAFSPTGRFLAVGHHDAGFRVFSVGTNGKWEEVYYFKWRKVNALCFNSTETYLTVGVEDEDFPSIEAWEVPAPGAEWLPLAVSEPRSGYPPRVGLICSSGDGRHGIAVGDDKKHMLYIWDLESGEGIHEDLFFEDKCNSISFCAATGQLAVGVENTGAKLLLDHSHARRSLTTDIVPPELSFYPDYTADLKWYGCVFSPDGRLAISTSLRVVYILEIASGNTARVELEASWDHKDNIASVAWASDSQYFYAGTWKGAIVRFVLADSSSLHFVFGGQLFSDKQGGAIYLSAISSRGLLVACSTKCLYFLDTLNAHCILQELHGNYAYKSSSPCVFSPSGSMFALGCKEDVALFSDGASGWMRIASLRCGAPSAVNALCFEATGTHLLVALTDGRVCTWRIPLANEEWPALPWREGRMCSSISVPGAFTHDGRHFFYWRPNSFVVIGDVEDLCDVSVVCGSTHKASSFSFHEVTGLLLVMNVSLGVQVWRSLPRILSSALPASVCPFEFRRERVVATPNSCIDILGKEPNRYVPCKASPLSPDGTLLAVANSGYFRIVETATGSEVSSFEIPSAHILSRSAWSPDGRDLITAEYNARSAFLFSSRGRSDGRFECEEKIKWDSSVSEPWFAFSSRGELAMTDDKSQVVLLGGSELSEKQTLLRVETVPERSFEEISCMRFSSSDRFLAIAQIRNQCIVLLVRRNDHQWDHMTNFMLSNISHTTSFWPLCFDKLEALLALGTGGRIYLFQIPSPSISAPLTVPPVNIFGNHAGNVTGVIFSEDSSYIISGASDRTVRIWRVSNGCQTVVLRALDQITSLSFHAPSGVLAAGLNRSGAQLWRCAPLVTPPTIRERLAAAQLALTSTDDEPSPKRRRGDVEDEVVLCTRLLDELADCLEHTGVAQLRDDHVLQWLHDVGLGHMARVYGHVTGLHLRRLRLWDIERRGFSFADACSLLLHVAAADRGAHVDGRQLLWWDAAGVAVWLRAQEGLAAVAEALVGAGWTGACLCSLTVQRVVVSCEVVEAVAVRLFEHVDAHRASEEDVWARSWTALSDMPNAFVALRF